MQNEDKILQILHLFKETKGFPVSLCGRKHLSFSHKCRHVRALGLLQTGLARPCFSRLMKDELIRLMLRPRKTLLMVSRSWGGGKWDLVFPLFLQSLINPYN